jgi:DinB family protein
MTSMELAGATTVLARTPTVLAALLTGLPTAMVHRDDGPGTWSAYAIVGHLQHGDETNWIARTRMILNHGADRTFEAFDREAMLRQEPVGVDDLLDGFRRSRARALDELASLGPLDLDRHGRHPEFGEVTLGQLLASWVAHDLTHLAQVGEVLARSYRTAVGPWRAYMPALDRVAEAE